MKKVLSVVLAVTMILCALAPLAAYAAEESPYEKYKAIEGKEYTFTKAGWLAGPVDNDAGMIVNLIAEETGVRFKELNLDGNAYNEALNLLLSAGEVPDLFNYPTSSLQRLVDEEVAFTFDEEMLAELAPDLYKLYETEVPGVLNYCKAADGKVAAVFQYKLHSKFFRPLVWRNDWLKNVGIDKVPETFDEAEKALYAFAKDDPDQNGQDDTFGINRSGMDMVYSYYGYIPTSWSENEDGELVFGGIQPEMKEALSILAKWRADGVLDPEWVVATGENQGGRADITHLFINDKIGMSMHSEYFQWSPVAPIGMNYSEFFKAHEGAPEDTIAVAQPIKREDGTMKSPGALPLTGVFYISKKMADAEPDKVGAILKVLNWIAASYDNYLTGWYGIKDVMWEYDENNQPLPIGDYIDKALQNKEGAYTSITLIEPYGYWGKIFEDRNSWAIGLGLDTPDVIIRNELIASLPARTDYETELERIRVDAYTDFINGNRSLDEFDDFVQEWLDNGGAELVEQAQEWYAGIK